jgi:hypothetical protein
VATRITSIVISHIFPMWVRKLIPTRKRAITVHIQAGIYNPEGPIGIVNAGHKVCPRVDANCGLAAAD